MGSGCIFKRNQKGQRTPININDGSLWNEEPMLMNLKKSCMYRFSSEPSGTIFNYLNRTAPHWRLFFGFCSSSLFVTHCTQILSIIYGLMDFSVSTFVLSSYSPLIPCSMSDSVFHDFMAFSSLFAHLVLTIDAILMVCRHHSCFI